MSNYTGPAGDCEIYCFSYRHAGATWTLQIPCFNWADAHARATLLNLTLDGKLCVPGESHGVTDETLEAVS